MTLSPCLFNIYAEYIVQNAQNVSWMTPQLGIKIVERNINMQICR